MTDYVTWISQVGFPIIIALWFMLRLEKRWDQVLDVVTKEAEQLRILSDYIQRKDRD